MPTKRDREAGLLTAGLFGGFAWCVLALVMELQRPSLAEQVFWALTSWVMVIGWGIAFRQWARRWRL
jgi:hypothetical protein